MCIGQRQKLLLVFRELPVRTTAALANSLKRLEAML